METFLVGGAVGGIAYLILHLDVEHDDVRKLGVVEVRVLPGPLEPRRNRASPLR